MNFANVMITEANGGLWAENAGIRIKIPAEIAARLNGHKSGTVSMGIRPEDLRVASNADPADLTIETGVEVVEQLGSEILLDVKAGPNTLVASVEPTVRVKPQDRMRLAVNPNRIHFFDAQTENVI